MAFQLIIEKGTIMALVIDSVIRRTMVFLAGSALASAILITNAGQLCAQDASEEDLEKALRPSPELIETLRKAQKLGQQEKFGELAKLMAEEVKKNPEDKPTLFAAAQFVQQVAFQFLEDEKLRDKANPFFYDVSKYMRKLNKLHDGKLPGQLNEMYSTAIYNEACCLSLEGKKDKAIKVLEESVKAGFSEYDVIKDDADFNPLREDPKFKKAFEALVEKVKKNVPKPRIRT